MPTGAGREPTVGGAFAELQVRFADALSQLDNLSERVHHVTGKLCGRQDTPNAPTTKADVAPDSVLGQYSYGLDRFGALLDELRVDVNRLEGL